MPAYMIDDPLLNRRQAAAYLASKGCRTSAITLAVMAMDGNAGRGPPMTVYRHKSRGYVSYRRSDLDAWAEKKLRRVE